jgi:hypothetical protein
MTYSDINGEEGKMKYSLTVRYQGVNIIGLRRGTHEIL